jgi:hypothetical protein
MGSLALRHMKFLGFFCFCLQRNGQGPTSAVHSYVNAHLNLALLRGSSLCLCGSGVPADTITLQHCPQWDDPVAAFYLHPWV